MINKNVFGIDQKLYRKIYQSYIDQKKRCENKSCKAYKWYGGKGITVEYNLEQFVLWWLSKPIVENPSVGRINHEKNYTLNNIELVSRSQNSKERILRSGTPKQRKPVSVFKDGNHIGKFESAKKAALILNLHHGHVIAVLNGKERSHKGFTFCSAV